MKPVHQIHARRKRFSWLLIKTSLSAWLLLPMLNAPSAQAYEIDDAGRISLVVGFHESSGPIPTAKEQLFYCAVMEACNQFIWQQTNRQHWIGEVTFVWQTGGAENSACPDVHWTREDGRANVTYHPWCSKRIAFLYDEVFNGFVQPAENLGWILSHELGHLIYRLDDEYQTFYEKDVLKAANICVDEGDSTCVMADRYVGHWCDDTNHLETNDDWPGFSNPAASDYRCWDDAQDSNMDLQHTDGDYLPPNSPPESVTCQFLDPGNVVNDAVLLLDRSGSMSYTNPHGIEAIRLAIDAALLFYNKTEPGEYSGVVGFNDMVVNPWPIPYGPFGAEVTSLNITANGMTDICAAIQAATQAIVNQGNGGNRNIILFSDGKDNFGCDPVEAASEAKVDHDITVHTIAYGDADRDELQNIADAGGGTARSAGNNSPLADEPNAHELKADVTRASFGLMGRVEVYEQLAQLPPDVGTNVFEVEETFYVPIGTQTLDFVWLGNRFDAGASFLCSFSRLAFELESPAAVIYPSIPVDDTVDGEYATARVLDPEVGTWIARVDTSQLVCPTNHDLQLAWQGHTENADVFGGVWIETPRAPLDRPVVIQAQMFNGGPTTDITTAARIRHLGQEWLITMTDDGQGADERTADGTYTGIFNSAGQVMAPGAYQVTVTFLADEAIAAHADVGILPDPNDLDSPPTPPGPRTAIVLAEGMFRLSARYSLDPQGRISTGVVIPGFSALELGQSYARLILTVRDIPLVQGRVRLGLGDGIDISNISISYTYPDLGGDIIFNAAVSTDAPCGEHVAGVQFVTETARSSFIVNIAAGGTPGDLDGDGQSNMTDVNIMVGLLLGTDTDECRKQRADLNSNGIVEGGDIQLFTNALLDP